VQLDAVEAGVLGAARRLRKELGQHLRQLADVRQLDVGHALAIAVAQRLELAGFEDARELFVGELREMPAHERFGPALRAEPLAVPWLDLQKPREELLRLGTAADRKEVDDLDEEPRVAFARPAHRLRELLQTGNEAIVSDAQQRSARDVAYSGGLDDDRARPAPREALVPLEVVVGDEPVLRRAPRHHGRHPGSALEPERADLHRAEERGRLRLRARGPTARRGLPSDAFRWAPHGGPSVPVRRARGEPRVPEAE
jgi:hypothetical protein